MGLITARLWAMASIISVCQASIAAYSSSGTVEGTLLVSRLLSITTKANLVAVLQG